MSSQYDLLDQAHRLHYLADPIVDASDDGVSSKTEGIGVHLATILT